MLAMQVPNITGFVFIKFDTYIEMKHFVKTRPCLMIPGHGIYNYNDLEINDTMTQQAHFYEVIQGNQCPYWDIDGISVDDVSIESTSTQYKNAFRIICDVIRKEFISHSIVVNLYDSSGYRADGKFKFSYHLVVKGVYVNDHISNKKLTAMIMECYEKVSISVNEHPILIDGFDQNVYTSKRNLRLLGSTKLNDRRVKRYASTLYQSPQYHSAYINDDLYMSMITCIMDADQYEIITVRKEYQHADISNEMIDRVLELTNYMFPGIFKLGQVTKGIINLRRQKPSYCNICQRNHDNSDAFVTNGNQFRCYRNPKSTPINLDQDQDEEVELVVSQTPTKSIALVQSDERMIKVKKSRIPLEEYVNKLIKLTNWVQNVSSM